MQKFWGQLRKIISIHDKSISKKVSKSMTFVENIGIFVVKLACDICVIDFYTTMHRPDAHHKRTFVPSHRLCPIIDAMSRAFIKGAKNAIKVTDHAWEFAMALHVGILPSLYSICTPSLCKKFFAILLENQYSEEAQITQEILISLFEN